MLGVQRELIPAGPLSHRNPETLCAYLELAFRTNSQRQMTGPFSGTSKNLAFFHVAMTRTVGEHGVPTSLA